MSLPLSHPCLLSPVLSLVVASVSSHKAHTDARLHCWCEKHMFACWQVKTDCKHERVLECPSPLFTVPYYQCMCWRVGVRVGVRILKGSRPQLDVKGLCAIRALWSFCSVRRVYHLSSGHIYGTRTQCMLPTSKQFHLTCHRLRHLSITAE